MQSARNNNHLHRHIQLLIVMTACPRSRRNHHTRQQGQQQSIQPTLCDCNDRVLQAWLGCLSETDTACCSLSGVVFSNPSVVIDLQDFQPQALPKACVMNSECSFVGSRDVWTFSTEFGGLSSLPGETSTVLGVLYSNVFASWKRAACSGFSAYWGISNRSEVENLQKSDNIHEQRISDVREDRWGITGHAPRSFLRLILVHSNTSTLGDEQ